MQDPRQTYLSVASRSFAESGYHGTSLDAVARSAGVTKQALLHFFGSKTKLYAAVLSQLSDRLSARIEAAFDPDPRRHLTRYFESFVSEALSRPEESRLVMHALLDSDGSERVWPLRAYLDRLAELAALARRESGLSEAPVRAWVIQILGSVQFLAVAAPTFQGMYGDTEHAEDRKRFQRLMAWEVADFLGFGQS